MKNFLKVFVIILSLSVSFAIGILNVSASDIGDVGYNEIDLSGISSLSGYNEYYTVLKPITGTTFNPYNSDSYQALDGTIYLQFYHNYDAGFYYYETEESSGNSLYWNDVCSSVSEYGCFPRLISSYRSSRKLGASYYSNDYGHTWIQDFPDNYAYTTNPIQGYVIYTTAELRTMVNDVQETIYNYGYKYYAPVDFSVTYEQGEVIMSQYENSSANLVSQYIETDLNPQDYNFIYSYDIGNGLQSITYEPICTESFVNNNIHYSCYYNIPLFFNTTLNFEIQNKNTLEYIYSYSYYAYLSILPDFNYYNTYRFTGYKYANISGIDTGSFGLSQYTYTSILHDNKTEIDYNIYVYDSSTGTQEDFITSQYYVSTRDENGVMYHTFDFNGNSNLYLTIVLNDYRKYVDFDADIYLFSPSTAYTHLSSPVECYNTEDISSCEHLATLPQHQQSYKDNNDNTINESNSINYYDNENDFFNQLDSLFGSNQSFKGLTGIISSPLNVIRNLTTSTTCTDINLPIPYVNNYITLPCMSSIYSTYFGDFYILYQSITFAIIGYYVIVKFIATIKDLYNPDEDKIEVIDL